MGYEGRSLLLDDGEEWVNIPLVVREFMRQLNDEVHASRSAMEAMRQEQKEVNVCLRRVMQKQADLDMDNARNTLSLKRSSQEATYARHSDQIHYLRKKQERLDEKVQLLAAKVSAAPPEVAVSFSGPSGAALVEELSGLSAKIDSCDRDLREHITMAKEARHSTEELIESTVSAATADMGTKLVGHVSNIQQRLASSETSVEAHREALEQLQQDSKRLRGVCGELSDVVESDRRINKERLTTCLQTIEKAETLCAAHRSGAEASIARLESAVEASAEKLRDEAKTLHLELRDLLRNSQHDVVVRCNELAEELLSVKDQQKRLQEQLANSENESVALRAIKAAKELAQRVTELESEAEQRSSLYLSKRDFQKSRQETQTVLDALSAANEKALSAFQVQLEQFGQSMKAVRAEQREDNDWLHNELGRMGTVLSYATQQRERQERQVTSLCDIAHNLSVAVEALQADKSKSKSGIVASGTPVKPSSHDAVPSPAAASAATGASDTAAASAPQPWESWRLQIVKETEAKLSASQHRCERLSQQLNELTAKVDGGARYAQAVVAQHMDNVRQSVKEEVSQQLHAHPALRELTPALVELEAAKRRVASLELEVQSVALRSERLSADDAARLSDSGAPASATLRRLESVEDIVSALQRRVADLSASVEDNAQQRSSVMRSVQQLDTRLQDQERVTAKFGADLTAALESVLHTGESLSQHQSKSASQLSELHTLIKRWESEVVALKEAQENGAAAQSSSQAGQESAVRRLEAEVARLSLAVEGSANDVAAEVTRRLRPVRADLEALQQECAASNERSATALTRCKQDLSTLMERRGDDELCAVRKEMRQSEEDTAAKLRALSERLSALEAAAAAVKQPASPAAEGAASGPSPQVSAAALARFTEALRDFEHRLDAQQQRMNTFDDSMAKTAAEHEEAMRRECKGMVEALRVEMMTWVSTHVAAQLKRCCDELRASTEEKATHDAPPSTEPLSMPAADVAELHQRIDAAERTVDSRCTEMAAQHHRELDEVLRQIDNMHATHADLCREVRDVSASRQAELEGMVGEVRDALDELREATAAATIPTTSAPAHASSTSVSAAPAKEDEEEKCRRWKDDVLQTVHAAFYTRSLLEERLENIWSSMVTLLARKEDIVAVNEKLNGLHQLLQEELQIEMEKLAEQLSGQLAEKVSLTGLQDMLEDHFMEPAGSNTGNAA